MKKLRLLSLVGITSIGLAHAGWAAGHRGGGGGHGGGGAGAIRTDITVTTITRMLTMDTAGTHMATTVAGATVTTVALVMDIAMVAERVMEMAMAAEPVTDTALAADQGIPGVRRVG